MADAYFGFTRHHRKDLTVVPFVTPDSTPAAFTQYTQWQQDHPDWMPILWSDNFAKLAYAYRWCRGDTIYSSYDIDSQTGVVDTPIIYDSNGVAHRETAYQVVIDSDSGWPVIVDQGHGVTKVYNVITAAFGPPDWKDYSNRILFDPYWFWWFSDVMQTYKTALEASDNNNYDPVLQTLLTSTKDPRTMTDLVGIAHFIQGRDPTFQPVAPDQRAQDELNKAQMAAARKWFDVCKANINMDEAHWSAGCVFPAGDKVWTQGPLTYEFEGKWFILPENTARDLVPWTPDLMHAWQRALYAEAKQGFEFAQRVDPVTGKEIHEVAELQEYLGVDPTRLYNAVERVVASELMARHPDNPKYGGLIPEGDNEAWELRAFYTPYFVYLYAQSSYWAPVVARPDTPDPDTYKAFYNVQEIRNAGIWDPKKYDAKKHTYGTPNDPFVIANPEPGVGPDPFHYGDEPDPNPPKQLVEEVQPHKRKATLNLLGVEVPVEYLYIGAGVVAVVILIRRT